MIPFISTFRLHLQLRKANLFFIDHKDKNAIPIYQSDKVSVPFSTGIFKPKIYVPAIWETWSPECRQMILKHEIAHIKRGDGFMRMIQNITHALYFFHPLIWVLNRKVHDYREMACDDSAVQKEKAVSIEYAKALVQIAENLVQSNIGCASASALIRQKHELLNRVKYQMEGTMKNLSKTSLRILIGILLLLAFTLSWYCSREAPSESDVIKQDPISEAELARAEIEKDLGIQFTEFDVPPKPVGGFSEIQKNLDYPDLAKKAGIEGRVTLYAHIGADGKILETKIYKSLGDKGCDQAAIAAIQAVKWEPAQKNGKQIAVWIAVPFDFKLNNSKKDDEKDIIFVPFDKPPQPIGGFAALQSNVHYPDLARRAGIEGRVTVYAQISEAGEVISTKVVQSLGDNGCDKAAIEAIKATQWIPAKQEDKPVTVWIAVPIQFSLSSQEK